MPRIDVDGPANLAPVTTAETIVATLNGVNTPAGGQVVLTGSVTGTSGAAATGIQLRIRRGLTTAGAQVGQTAQEAVGAAAAFGAQIQVDDNPGEVAGQSYVLTMQQIAATGNAANVNGNLRADF